MRVISLLRGINVSGQKKIKMADLRSLYEGLGFQNVTTYIQSGNVIFDTNLKKHLDAKRKIEQAILEKYNFDVPVTLRSVEDFKNLIKNCPIKSIDPKLEGSKVLVSFLSDKPENEKFENLLKYVVKPEELMIRGSEVYLRCPNGYGKSKLNNNFIENKLCVGATTRNWKTILKLIEMSSRDNE